MLGLNNYVIIIVVNDIFNDDKRPTNYFDQTKTIRLAAFKTMSEDTKGNTHARSDIQKQAYPPDSVKEMWQAYGITGTKFETHLPYKNGKLLSMDYEVLNKDEIILIRKGLDISLATQAASVNRVLPERYGS